MAHGVFEELGRQDLVLWIRAHGARPLRSGGERSPGALVAFREKPPGVAIRRILHERPARLVPGLLLAPELPEDARVREARRDGSVAVLDRVVPRVLRLLQGSVLFEERRAVVRDGIGVGEAVLRDLELLAGLLGAPRFLERLGETPVSVLVGGEDLHGFAVAGDRLVPLLLVPELLAEERPRVVVARKDRDGLAQMRHGLGAAVVALRVPRHVVMRLRRA